MPNAKSPSGAANTPQVTELEKTLAGLSASLEGLVFDTIVELRKRGIETSDLEPLEKLKQAARALDPATVRDEPEQAAPASASTPDAACADRPNQDQNLGRDHRTGMVEASTNLLARASAIIDVMVRAGKTPEHAAQIITRQLLGVGIKLPESGGDSRAWKRLFNWRNSLIHYKKSGQAWDAYCAFKEQLNAIPPEERLRRAVGERLWDLRKQEMAEKHSA